MPFDADQNELADAFCPCGQYLNSAIFRCDPTTSSVFSQACYQTSLLVPETTNLINQSIQPTVCPTNSAFPIVDGLSVEWNARDPPFRVALDRKVSLLIGSNIFDSKDPAESLNLNCNEALNGVFPGCSRTTGGRSCAWKPIVSGQKLSDGTYESCGGPMEFWKDSGFGVLVKDTCATAATFCQRVQWDYTYRNACCRQRLGEDFGLSESVWLRYKFQDEPNSLMGSTKPNEPFIFATQSQSYNPYQIYCDPQWCPNSAACDSTFFELCRWSTTTNDDGVIHACLAGTGECAQWYSNSTAVPTPQTALITGTHDWLLIDTMIKDYCLNSASTLSDTQSCACVGYGVTEINQPSRITYFTSCSTFGITTNCPNDVVPVVPVNAAPNDPGMGTPQILSDPVCGNIQCLDARNNSTQSFLTTNVLQRALACPTQTCILAAMNTTFSAADIGTGTRYIANNSQACFGTSFSANAPTYRIVEFPTLWFWTNVGNSITNPNQTSILRFENVSQDPNTPMNWSLTFNAALPSWLQFQGPNFADFVLPGQNMSVEFALSTVSQIPAYFDLPITLFMLTNAEPRTTFSKQDLTLNFAIVEVDKPTVPGSGNGNNITPSGVPLNVKSEVSPAGFAMMALIGILFVVGVFLIMQGFATRSLARNALIQKRMDSI